MKWVALGVSAAAPIAHAEPTHGTPRMNHPASAPRSPGTVCPGLRDRYMRHRTIKDLLSIYAPLKGLGMRPLAAEACRRRSKRTRTRGASSSRSIIMATNAQ